MRLTAIAHLKQALALKKSKGSVNWVEERLAKLPPGYDGLGDRGFEGTSTIRLGKDPFGWCLSEWHVKFENDIGRIDRASSDIKIMTNYALHASIMILQTELTFHRTE